MIFKEDERVKTIEKINFLIFKLLVFFKVLNADPTGKFAPRLEEIEEEEGRKEEERKVINSSVEDEEEEEGGSGKRMMGSFHSSASSGSSTLDMMGRVVREGNSKEERRGRSKHQVLHLLHFYPIQNYLPSDGQQRYKRFISCCRLH